MPFLAPARLVTFLVALGVLAFSAAASPPEEFLRRAGVNISVPKGWSSEEIEEGKVLFLLAPPIDGGYDSSVSIELKPSRRSSVAQEMAWFSSYRATSTVQYKELGRSEGRTPNGLRFGLVEYSHIFHGIPTYEWFLVVPRDKGSFLLVYAMTTQRVVRTSIPVFRAFLNSIEWTQ